MKRSVERISGVAGTSFDLSTGTGKLWVKAGATVVPAAVWQAITKSGFSPVSIKHKNQVYTGPGKS